MRGLSTAIFLGWLCLSPQVLAADVPTPRTPVTVPRGPTLSGPSTTGPSTSRQTDEQQQIPFYIVPLQVVPMGNPAIAPPGLTVLPSRQTQQDQTNINPYLAARAVQAAARRVLLCRQCLREWFDANQNTYCFDGLLCRDANFESVMTYGPRDVLAQQCPICSFGVHSDIDNDFDGANADIDCDDNDPDRYPGNVEICDINDKDEDCDPSTVGERDFDGDTFTDQQCANYAGRDRIQGMDCDDSNPSVHPYASEVCDGIDNNCNGQTDEHTQVRAYLDFDGDGFGDGNTGAFNMCLTELFQPDTTPPTHYSLYNTDCDDNEPRKNPGAPEVRDGLDNDCNSVVDDVVR